MLKLIFYKKSDFSIVSVRVEGSSNNVALTANSLFLEFISDHKFLLEDYGYAETDFPEDWAWYCWDADNHTYVKNPNIKPPKISVEQIPATDTSISETPKET